MPFVKPNSKAHQYNQINTVSVDNLIFITSENESIHNLYEWIAGNTFDLLVFCKTRNLSSLVHFNGCKADSRWYLQSLTNSMVYKMKYI